MNAAQKHDAMVAAYNDQQARVNGRRPGDDIWTGRLANVFRDDPRRPLDPILDAIAAHLRETDVLVDAGGGAGRMSLPLALRCRQVLNVDPSEGMREVFESVKAEAGIQNARFIRSEWTEASAVEGDVVLNAHVTYFVSNIRGFVERLVAAARRRVIININSVPPPNSGADLFELQHGQPQALVPAHVELVPVLWEMGILPDIQVLRAPAPGPTSGLFPDRDAAIDSIVLSPLARPEDADQLRDIASTRFDELFVAREGGYLRTSTLHARPMIITWEPA